MIVLPIEPLCQGRSNGCGTASLAMCLNYLDNFNTEAHRFTQALLDEGHRAWNSFCAPHMLLEIARKQGFYGAIYPRTTLTDIRRHLQAKRPVIALYSVDGTLGGLHYSVINGLQLTGNPNNPLLLLQDPASGQSKSIAFDEFERRFWPPLHWRGLPSGLQRMTLVFSAADNLPPSGALPWTLLGAYQVNRLINTLARCLNI